MSRALWLLFAVFIVYGTTIPFDFTLDRSAIVEKVAAVQWNPLARADGRRVSIPDAVQNVMLFVPFGVLGALACRRRFPSSVTGVAVVTAAAAALSVVVEGLQLLTVDRVTSLSDVATNTVGGFLGASAAARGRSRWLELLREHGSATWAMHQSFYPVLVSVVVLAVAAWQPFDVTLDVGSIASKVRQFMQDPMQGGPLTDEGSALVLYALAVMALGAWFEAIGVARPAVAAGTAGAVLAIILELSQTFVSSRVPSAWDALVRIVGALAGATLWPEVGRTRSRKVWVGLAFVATTAAAAVTMLSPFTVEGSRQPFSWFPFLGYYTSNWFPTVSHVIEVMLVYLPFGFVLGLSGRRQSLLIAGVTSFLAAAVIEYLQSWVVGRYADVTDVACGVTGAILGAWLATSGAVAFEQARASAHLTRRT